MTSYDTLTGLRIARDTQRDSVSMKTISWLTMVFLPATFVATFFSMGFFQFHQDSKNHVNISVAPEWWLYLAVTLPGLNTQKSAPSSLSTHPSLHPFDAAFTSAHPERG
jgi:hypothetical protein